MLPTCMGIVTSSGISGKPPKHAFQKKADSPSLVSHQFLISIDSARDVTSSLSPIHAGTLADLILYSSMYVVMGTFSSCI